MKWTWLPLLALPLFGRSVTFDKDIAPITFRFCAPCHHAGGSAPFPLLTYKDVRKHAAQVVAVTERRYMPPWPPESGYGDFVGERRLTEAQLRLIAAWVGQGAREGNAAGLPSAPHFEEGWQMGPPDLIVQMPKPYPVPAAGGDIFRNFILPVDLKETKYVRAVELRPGNEKVVHHANTVIDRAQLLRHRDGEDGQPGFPGMDVTTEGSADLFDPDSHFLFWKPGSVLEPAADAMSWRLDPGTDLIINLHLQPTGKPELIQPSIGLYFSSHAPTLFPILLQLENDGALNIPPGERQFSVTDQLRLPVSVDVLAIYPHAHYVGKQVEAWATLPDGTRRWLIKIPDWDINWQAVYTYRQPVTLPAGTTVGMRITYDNSSSNPRNPSHPPMRVHGGNRSIDEMGHVWLQVLPKKDSQEDPRLVLEEAAMRRRLEKYPADFLAHYNLGALCQFRGKMSEAIDYYQQALQVEPQNTSARNSLGAALMAQDRLDDAVAQFREVLRIDPRYLNARYNLARVLAAKNDLDSSANEYSAFLKDKADDPDAQIGLGTVLFVQHRYDEALPHFREAARLKPTDADIQTDLGALLAIEGDLTGATQAFEQALRINPDHKTARADLAKAREGLAAKQPAQSH
ncbi:MAG: tetratricopeptide repeat protein [Bryobacteraceae bacterium]